jgi:eukaryotic-like serine/threonine-protein kinase
MDATRLPPAVQAADPAATMPDQPAPVAARFLPLGIGHVTPTGTVSDASDATAGGTVSLKLVPPEVLPTTAMADRALRELKQLAKVTSARIVRVVDQGKLSDGRIYVATERVDGMMTLEDLVADGPLSVERAKVIVLQVGEALTEAQKVGVIHRDVAPRNVLVGPGDHVKVADFGLAEAVSDKVFGAPAFMSPEQAEGKPVDQRSNIYSLGAMFYYALVGKPPFEGDVPTLMHQHLHAIAPAPSLKRPTLGTDIDRVIAKALEKSGGRRHLTLRQLLTEIGATSSAPQSQVRSDAGAKTMMAMEAPVIPPAPSPAPRAVAVPSAIRPNAQTIMGVSPLAPLAPAAPVAPVAPPITETLPTAPFDSQPSTMASDVAPEPESPPARPMPTPAPQAAPQQATMMVEPPARPMPTPAPRVAPQQATMMAEPPARPMPTPAPQVAQQATMMAEAPGLATSGNDAGRNKKGFRETAWFKRGELEEEMAKAQAAVAGDPLKSGTTGKEPVLDESQVALSSHDQARLSLKTGGTQAMPVIRHTPHTGLPGERMDEDEMMAEIAGSRRYLVIGLAVVVAVVLGLVIYFATRGGGAKAEAPPATPPAPMAASPPAVAPPSAPLASTALVAPPSASAALPTPTSPSPKSPAPAAPGYVEAVERVQTSGDKREIKRLEKAIAQDERAAHHKHDRATEATDKQLLARLKRAEKHH